MVSRIALLVSLAWVMTLTEALLIAEAFDVHVPKGYVYTAMLFSLGVESLNIRARGKRPAASK
jgi:predicted tellurium resistance membrane protein TerC